MIWLWYQEVATTSGSSIRGCMKRPVIRIICSIILSSSVPIASESLCLSVCVCLSISLHLFVCVLWCSYVQNIVSLFAHVLCACVCVFAMDVIRLVVCFACMYTSEKAFSTKSRICLLLSSTPQRQFLLKFSQLYSKSCRFSSFVLFIWSVLLLFVYNNYMHSLLSHILFCFRTEYACACACACVCGCVCECLCFMKHFRS